LHGKPQQLRPRRPKLSAVDVTAQTIFERLYLVSGLRQFAPFVTTPYAPTPPPLTMHLFVDFPVFFV